MLRTGTWHRGRANRYPYLLIAPAVAGLVLFQFYPMVEAVLGSLQRLNPFTHQPSGFAGLANYLDLTADPQFDRALVNTVLYVVLMVVIEIPLGMLLATMINSRLPGSRALRLAVIACLAASETVAILVWNQMYSTDGGVLNAVLGAVGLPPQPFVQSPGQALLALVVISVWKDLGLPT